jgi:hypothetical protein
MDKGSDLPNIYGKADIYGGKIDRGFTEVKVVSIDSPTKFKLAITDVNKASTETVLDRYEAYIVPNRPAVKLSTVVNVGAGDQAPPVQTVSIDYEKVKMFAVAGYLLKFNSFDGINLTYTVEKQ